jgi:hypothetical protein
MPENALFSPQKRSKKSVFSPFFALKHQKMHFFASKNALKTTVFVSFYISNPAKMIHFGTRSNWVLPHNKRIIFLLSLYKCSSTNTLIPI